VGLNVGEVGGSREERRGAYERNVDLPQDGSPRRRVDTVGVSWSSSMMSVAVASIVPLLIELSVRFAESARRSHAWQVCLGE
jgi:hypothetical protein